jgi:hypothetical protein
MNITTFKSEATIRWECMLGDYILWLSPKNLLSAESFSIVDMWQLKSGDVVTITNKVADFPSWFELHPTETSGRLAIWMGRRLRAGYKPKDIMDVPNLWRIRAGDRLVWVGPIRPWLLTENGVLGLIDIRTCALAIGESEKGSETLFFGPVNLDGLPLEDAALCESGIAEVKKLGMPRIINANKWALGG